MNRVALVTGATQGLGLALAEGLAARLDADDVVFLTGRSAASLEKAAASLKGASANVRPELLDVRDADQIEELAARIAGRYGAIDIVFSNAYRRIQPDDQPAEVIADYVDTNNFGTSRILRAFAPLVRDGGRLIVVASTMGTLHYLAPVLHARFENAESLADVDALVAAWRDGVIDGSAMAEAWPAFINIPSKVAQVAAVRALARERRVEDSRRDIFLAATCPGMVDTAASRAWYDMSRAQSPAQAAGPLLDLVLGPRPSVDLYGELVRFGERLPWAASELVALGQRGRPSR